MVKQVSLSAALAENRFDTRRLTKGWISEEEADPLAAFYTGDFLPVCGGDEVYFGAAVVTQWWHLVAYDRDKTPLRRGMLDFGVTFHQYLDEETAIMRYHADDDVCFIRMICDARYVNLFLVTVNRPFSAEEYRARMTDLDAAPATALEKCVPDEWTVIFHLTGEGTMTVGGRTLSFCPHSLVAVPPGVPFAEFSEEGFVDLHIGADTFSPSAVGKAEVITVRDDKSRSIETLFRLMLRLYWESAAHNRPLLDPLYNLIEQFILQRLSRDRPHCRCVEKLYDTLLLRFADPNFSLEAELERESYSPTHIRRLYRERFGCSPMETLMELRIRRAKALLSGDSRSPISIAQIAALSGFPDPYYFSRIFKQRVGCSPRDYRKANYTR